MLLFEEFFDDFKRSIYKNRGRRMEKNERIIVPFLITFIIISLVLFILYGTKIIVINKLLHIFSLILFALLSMALYSFLLLRLYRFNKKVDFVSLHKTNILEELIKLLKQPTYNFYNKSKIDWLISCCEEKLSRSKTRNTIS